MTGLAATVVSLAGILRPQVDRESSHVTEHTCDEIARALQVPERTVRRHVGVLAALGAPGVRRGQRPDMARWGWLVSDEMLALWKSGDVPAPWASAIKAMAA